MCHLIHTHMSGTGLQATNVGHSWWDSYQVAFTARRPAKEGPEGTGDDDTRRTADRRGERRPHPARAAHDGQRHADSIGSTPPHDARPKGADKAAEKRAHD